MSDDIWDVLGLAPTRDRDQIRRAYARKLRATNPEDNAEGFMRLREAHDEALERIRHDWMWDDEGEDADESGAEAGGAPSLVLDSTSLQTLLRTGRIAQAETFAPQTALPPTALCDAATPEAEELRARFDRLESLLRAAERPPVSALEAAFHAVLNAEALDEIAVAAAVEARIADLLLHGLPRADPLLAPAIDAFRWRRNDLRFEPGPTVEALVARHDFVESRARMLKFDDYTRKVVELLQGPPSAKPPLLWRFDPGFDRAMKDMLGRIGDGDGALAADFDARTLTLWRERYARPRLSAGMVAAIGSAALLGPVFGVFLDKGLPGVIASALAAPTLVLAGLMAYLHGYLRLKTAWEDHRAWRAGILERTGWWPLSLALLLASALLPDTLASAGIVAGLAAPILAWTFITAAPLLPPAPLHHRLLAQVVPFAWALTLPLFDIDVVTQPVIVALAAAAAVDLRGGALSSQVWHTEIGKIGRVVGALAMLAAAIALGVTAWRMAGETPPTWAPLCVAGILALAIAHRLPVAILGEDIAKMRYYGMFALFWIIKGFDALVGSWLVTSSLWMLTGMVAGLILSLAIEARDRTR
ncbi:J domain-containing protein [Caulobacter hibisci]|uniref:J domain-containing protein n=1 Tax=Caulobacter hibisci TaxID=2035993 RepID=A0ABS0SS66_9CAUL|nr:J domain-containing protein [Caulobacter hibisci]MBI1682465.1 J domain-containing protein [Caulobacter hibisci]